MRKLFQPFFLLLTTLLIASFSGKEKCTVNFNGIYTASVDAETDAHIRFYNDGVVIVSTSVKNIKDVNKWFTRDNIDRVLKGKFKIKGCVIKFKVKGDTGEQLFSGNINSTSLEMQITDGKTKASTNRIYQFVAL